MRNEERQCQSASQQSHNSVSTRERERERRRLILWKQVSCRLVQPTTIFGFALFSASLFFAVLWWTQQRWKRNRTEQNSLFSVFFGCVCALGAINCIVLFICVCLCLVFSEKKLVVSVHLCPFLVFDFVLTCRLAFLQQFVFY